MSCPQLPADPAAPTAPTAPISPMPSAPAHVAGAAPFLKWAGGKSRLLGQYGPYLPRPGQFGRYFEPFLGSAALFFHLQPQTACLSDRNARLIELYQVVRDDVDSILPHLRQHRNERDYYYQVRGLDPAGLTPAERAARLIYLNKTCYNGLYRENSKGAFNVPFGRYKRPKICDEARLRAAAQALQGVDLCVNDFDWVLAEARPGDFIYFDPPYVPLSPTSSFTSYDRHGFGEEDHRRLAETVHQLTGRGCRVMVSNASAPLVYALYQGHGYQLVEIQARRNINSHGHKRGPVTELLILNGVGEHAAGTNR